MPRPLFLFLFLFLLPCLATAQQALGYQKPPAAILDLVDVPLAPGVLMDRERDNMVLLYRDAYKSIEELSQTEMRLGGLRIDPKTNIGSRTNYYTGLKVRKVDGKAGSERPIAGLPTEVRLANFTWSPDQGMIAATNTTTDGVAIWIVDLNAARATKITDATVNANMGDVVNWTKDGKHLLVKMLPDDRKALIDGATAVPTGPTISVADGKKAQNRTYQDLLKNPDDEANFETLARSTIVKVGLDGTTSPYLPTAMYRGLSFSPDGEYLMVTTVERPFSYLVPYYRFPNTTTIYDKDGKRTAAVSTVPLIEDLPKGFMAERPGRRDLSWRADLPHSLIYVEVLDGGDPAAEAEFRDEVFQLEAPFTGNGRSLIKLRNRFSGIEWSDEDLALVYAYWWDTRNLRATIFSPGNLAPASAPMEKVIMDRNYQDRYNDPGSTVTHANEYGRQVLSVRDGKIFRLGDGFTEEGQFPFLDAYDLKSGETERLYTSTYTDRVEDLRDYDVESNQLLVRIESATDYPNYYFRELDGDLRQLTDFANPFASLGQVHKEVISYKREDGLELSGTLYLPVGYDMDKKEKVPMILWAYPREFKDKSSAGQNTSNPNEFIYPYWGSPIYWVTRGYAILDDAAFPIVGEGEEEPNDSFREQLVGNAKAAIDAVDKLGYIDRTKVAVGGHSYGAFMVANLLSHSDLFAAGIARSGAYNRTLTPFGFQSEQRSYWEAPEVYYTMSPFMHADKMKTPLLLVHGEADNNSGTYPLQSERYFNALKGLGATVRLVMLPKESHGYRAKESILHLLWEQDRWLEMYLKPQARR